MKAWGLGLTVFALAGSAWGWTSTFGISGSDGFSGANGARGRSGQNVAVYVDGSPQTLVLNGSDGQNAFPGRDGADAWNCFQGRPAHDLIGARGGDGGTGGHGGSGGDGGDVILYYTNIADLKKIYVQSIGGRGGQGSYGGREGRPCFCQDHRWVTTHCRDERRPDGTIARVCYDVLRTCYDGSFGTPGLSGSSGSSGSPGTLTLIKSSQPLPENVTSDSEALARLPGRRVQLALNQFVTKAGSQALLAPGSILANAYREFTRREVATAEVVWLAPRRAEELGDRAAHFSFASSGVQLDLPSDVWAQIKTETHPTAQGTHTVFTVEQVLLLDEVRNVSFSVEGNAADVRVRVRDLAIQRELLSDSFNVTLWKDKSWIAGGDDRQFAGAVSSELIRVDGNDIILDIGKLPVEDAKTFKKGKKIKVKVTLTRSFSGRETSIESAEIKHKL